MVARVFWVVARVARRFARMFWVVARQLLGVLGGSMVCFYGGLGLFWVVARALLGGCLGGSGWLLGLLLGGF